MADFPKMIRPRYLLALVILGGPVEAQEWSAGVAMRTLERPGHEALMVLAAGADTILTLFETDGCSGGLSEAWHVVASQLPNFAKAHQSLPPWESCCVKHDRAYHNAAGVVDATDSFEARLAADFALKTCVVSSGTERVDALVEIYDLNHNQIEIVYERIAEAMFLAVRIGGLPCTGLPWRWGYGYPSCSVPTEVFE